jgi:hypothetical protein
MMDEMRGLVAGEQRAARLLAVLPSPFLLSVALAAGCGTTRMTDTQRTATEQLLVSNAIDQAVGQLDVRPLAGKPVYFDPQYLDGTVDRGYLISSLRQHLLANGCQLLEERSRAAYVVEARSGGVGTDRHSLLVGIPQTTVPAILPGQPTQIPEIPFAKKTDQNGVAKVALFAYNRQTGQPVWQSGLVQSLSTSRDMWVLGTGPFENGTIRKGTEFAGEPIPLPHLPGHDPAAAPQPPLMPLTQAAAWPERPRPATGAGDKQPSRVEVVVPPSLASAAGTLIQAFTSGAAKGDPAPPPKPSGSSTSRPDGANAGGMAETQPRQVMTSGLGAGSGD